MKSAGTLPRRSLRDDIFEFLHKRILAGEIQPGEWLRQEEIASQLGVSMTPVREALDLLVSTGLAERELYRGVHVVELTREEILDAYGLRVLLEPIAAWQAALNGTLAEVAILTRIHTETLNLVRLEDIPQLRELSRQFHHTISLMTRSPLFERISSIIANKFPDWMLYEAMFHHPDALSESLRLEQKQHHAILYAIETRDPSAASNAAREHILTIGKDLETYLAIPQILIREKETQFFAIGLKGKHRLPRKSNDTL